jgi:hypothetical protein
MEPDAVARLLACMDPNEAVLLLSALGDSTSKLVANHLTTEDRDRLVEVSGIAGQLDSSVLGSANGCTGGAAAVSIERQYQQACCQQRIGIGWSRCVQDTDYHGCRLRSRTTE